MGLFQHVSGSNSYKIGSLRITSSASNITTLHLRAVGTVYATLIRLCPIMFRYDNDLAKCMKED